MRRPIRFNVHSAICTILFLTASLGTWNLAHGTANAGAIPRLEGLIRNVGQWPSEVVFASRGADCIIWVTTWGVVVDRFEVDKHNKEIRGFVETTKLDEVGIKGDVLNGELVAEMRIMKGRTNSVWRNVPVFNNVAVTYDNGMTLIEYISLPGGLVSQTVRPVINGRALSISKSIVYGVYMGTAQTDQPREVIHTRHNKVYVAGSTTTMEFPRIEGSYRKTLVGNTDGFIARIDSTLSRVEHYTLLGGGGDDVITCIASDVDDNVFVAGETDSPDFPISTGVTGQVHAGENDAFVSMLDPELKALRMSTFFGGNREETATDITVNESGSIYICGKTNSTSGLPVTFPPTIPIKDWWGNEIGQLPGGGAPYGRMDGFIARISQSGRVLNGRYLGGELDDEFTAMVLDNSSSVYLVGKTNSEDFHTAPTKDQWYHPGRIPYDTTFNGGASDAVVVKLLPDLGLSESGEGCYSTYFGGNGDDVAVGIVVDNFGRAYVVGTTKSTDLPTTGGWRTVPIGETDVFLSTLSPDGKAVVGCTYYGGSMNEEVKGASALPGSNSILIYGTTTSADMPVGGIGAQDERNGSSDGFLAVLSTSANTYTTLVSGSKDDDVVSVSTDPIGDVYFLMETTSDDLITTAQLHETPSDDGVMYIGKHVFGTLNLISPVGGEYMCEDKTYTFSWQPMGMSQTEKYFVDISSNDGTTWQTVASNISGTTYVWNPSSVSTTTTNKFNARVRSARGHTSASMTFTVAKPPSIITHTQSASACKGGSTRLDVQASGEKLSYVWYKDGNIIPNATENFLNIAVVDEATAGDYQVRVNGACQPGASSTLINVSIDNGPVISEQPQGRTIAPGMNHTFTVSAQGAGNSYQWFRAAVDVPGAKFQVPGATSSELQIMNATEADEGIYTCTVTGSCGEVESAPATLLIDVGASVEDDLAYAGISVQAVPSVVSSAATLHIQNITGKDVIVSVFTTQGTEMWNGMAHANATSIALPEMPSGSYMVLANVDGKVVRNRFVVLR